MGRSRRAIASLLMALSLAGAAAFGTSCGDDDGSSTTSREDAPRPSAPRPDPAAGRTAEEFPGTFEDAKDLCGIGSRQKVAEIVGAKSTRPEAIARAVAKGYKPRLKKQAYEGCLAGLR
jgi:hypothetical protein